MSGRGFLEGSLPLTAEGDLAVSLPLSVDGDLVVDFPLDGDGRMKVALPLDGDARVAVSLPLAGELLSIYAEAREIVIGTTTGGNVEVRDLGGVGSRGTKGQPVREAFSDIAAAERRLAELRERLARDEVSDLNIAIHYVEPDDRG